MCIARRPRLKLFHGQTVSVVKMFCGPIANHFGIDYNWLAGKLVRGPVDPLQIVLTSILFK